MKRILCLLLAILLSHCLTACGGNSANHTAPNNDPTTSSQNYVDVGERCPSAQLTEIDQNGYTDHTFDPTTTGKITVINFWAYWCPPCVNELPHFDQVAREMADEVNVVAIHCDTVTQAQKFIAENYDDSSILFAMDKENDPFTYYSALGGTGSIPYTVILDTRGVICKKFVGAIDYNKLVSAIEACK